MGNRPNFCHLLGLNPQKESTYSNETILKKIDDIGVKWSNESRNKQNDPQMRFKYQKLEGYIDEMKRVLTDPVLKRKEFADAKEELKSKAQKLKMDCVILPDGTHLVFGNAVDAFVKTLHWNGVSSKDVMDLVGLKQGAPKSPVKSNITNTFKEINGVDTYTPVELLNVLITHPNLEINLDTLTDGSSPSQIKKAFEVCEKRVNSVRPDMLPEQDSYIQALRAIKLCFDGNDLEILTRYGKCQRALEPVMETMTQEYSRQFTRKYIDELLNAHLTKDVDYEMALSILAGFCYKKKFPANFSRSDSTLMRCPHCAAMVEIGPNTLFCPSCGKNFKIQCPSCKTMQDSKNTICIKCGFDFQEGENKAKRLALEFRTNMSKGKVIAANRNLMMLREIYPTYNGISIMDNDLKIAKEDLASRRKLIMEASDKKRFYEVKTMTEALMGKYPDAVNSDSELSQKYTESVSKFNLAEQYCIKAKAEASRPARMKYYVQAMDACHDHPVAKAKLKEDPPTGPSDPYVTIDKNCTFIRFSEYEDTAGTTYCIFRQRGSLPVITDDSKPLAEIPTTTRVFTDKNMESGVEYYYAVHTKRYGILSRENIHFGPIFICAPVDEVTIDEAAGGLRIMYEKPRGAYRVRAWREENSKNAHPIEIGLNNMDVYDDYVPGGKEYKYTFIAEYKVGNHISRSDPTVIYKETLVAPNPVNNMMIKRDDEDGSFLAKWNAGQEPILYSTPKKIPVEGISYKMEDIEAWMTPVKVIEKYADGVRFRLPDGDIEYIYPITPMGKRAIKGREILVSNARPFRDLEYVLSGTDCIITMVWPEGAALAKIVVSNDTYKSIDDASAEVHTIRREKYMEDRQIRISMGQSPKRCFNLYAIYNVDNVELNARGVAFEVYSQNAKKVRYTVKEERNGMRLDFQTDSDVTEIPPIVAIQVVSGIPLKKNDGETIWRSHGPVQLVQGKGSLNVQCKNLSDISKMRLFFVNDSDYNMFRFIHPLYGRRD